MKNIIKIVLLAAAVLIIAASCSKPEKKNNTQKNKEEYRYPVSIITPEKGSINLVYRTSGKTKPNTEQKAWSKYNGKIVEMSAEEGDIVKENQILALVDRDIAGMNFKYAEVKAPLSGVIIQKISDVGDNIAPGAPIYVIGDLDPIEIEITVPEKYLNLIQNKNTEALISFEALPNPISGKIDRILPLMHPVISQPVAVIQINNKGNKILPMAFAKIDLILQKKKDVFIVSKDLVKRDSKGEFLYVPENGKAGKLYVETGIKNNGRIEIMSGLSENIKLIDKGHSVVGENSLISIIEE